MPRSRSYSRSPSRNSKKKSSRRSRSREKYASSSRRRSSSRSRSKKVSSRYKSPSPRRRSRTRSGDRRRKSKYYSTSKNDYRRERSRSRDRDRYSSKRRSRSTTSSSSRTSTSSYSASSTSTVASKISIKSEKELQVIPLKMPSQPVTQTKNTLKFSSVDLVGEDFVKPEVIEELNAEEFIPKVFQSVGKKHIPDNFKIDLSSESVSITTKAEDGEKSTKQEDDDSIFHPNLFGDETVRMDKWVRKLYTYRQKMFLAEN